MRSRTDSESVATSRPSTRAEPPLSGKRPVSILMTVVFPLPLGPRKPKISPFSTWKLTSLTAVKLPKRRTRCSAEMATSPFDCRVLAMASIPRLQFHIRGHAGKHAAGGITDANLYTKNLVHAFLASLDISRQEFSPLIDLFEDPLKNCIWKRVDSNFGFLPELKAAIFGFGDVDANVNLVLFEKRGDGRIRSDKVARADVENFDDGGRGSDDLAFPKTGFVVRVGCFCQVDVFATVAALEFFQVGLSLMVVRFGGGDFLGTVALPGFFGVGARLLKGSLQFLVVKGDQDLARLNGIAFADQNRVDAAADLGADADIAGFDSPGTLEGSVAVEPAGIEPSGCQRHGSSKYDQDVLAVHETSLLR